MDSTPIKVKFDRFYNPRVLKVSCGKVHTGFVDSSGKLFMTGSNEYGQLGIGTFTSEFQPCLVKIEKIVTELACGNNHTLVATKEGLVYSMGHNSEGQLGLGTVSH